MKKSHARSFVSLLVAAAALLTLGLETACSERAPLAGGGGGGYTPVPLPPGAGPSDTGTPFDAAGSIEGYANGPYGKAKGQIFPSLTFQAFRDATAPWGTVAMKDFYDPDGAKQIRGVVVFVAAQWCGVCAQEFKWLPDAWETNYRAKGAQFLVVMIHDRASKPATQQVAEEWRAYYGIEFGVGIDPAMDALPFNTGPLALPYAYVIDPRTMKIEAVLSAAQQPPTIPALDALLTRNSD